MEIMNGYSVLKGTNQLPPLKPLVPGDEIKGYGGPPSVTVELQESDPNGKSAHELGSKLDAGKCAAGVLHDFAHALQAVANVGDFGMRKYTRGGWQAVPNGAERYFDAMWRHILKARHEEVDPDSKLPHLDHALWNLCAVIELRERAKAVEA